LMLLIEKVKTIGYSYDSETVLTLEEYFDGNDQRCDSICANTENQPSARELQEFLLAIRAKPSVHEVLVRVYDFGDALRFQDAWIISDTVFVITNASVSEIEDWFRPLTPSDVYEEKNLDEFNNLPFIPKGFCLIAVWWD
jgi:hypothetical protein